MIAKPSIQKNKDPTNITAFKTTTSGIIII